MDVQPLSRIGISSQEPDLMCGFSEDVKNLIEQFVKLFEQKESLRFEDFVTVWKDMNFGLIFTGRKLFRELWEFTEEALRSVKEYLLNSHETAERVAALYLLYALYFKQPARPRVKISLTLSDYELLTTFVQDCRNDEHWDISYVWVQLVTNYALVYVANTKPVGLEIMSKGDACSFEGLFRSNLAYKLNLDLFKRSLNNLSEIHEKYCNIKTALTDPGVRDPALGLISDKVPNKLKKLTLLLQSMRGESVDFGSDDEGDDPQHQREPRVRRPSIGERRKQLRAKAFEHSSITERNKLLTSRTSNKDQPDLSGASDDNDDAEYVPSSKVRGKSGSRRGSRARGRRGLPGRTAKTQLERSPSKSPIKSPTLRGLGRGNRSRGRGSAGGSKIFNKEFAEIAQSIEAVKKDPFILEGIVPREIKSFDAVDGAEQENPRKAIILHHKKKRKLEAKLRKKRNLAKAKLRNKSDQGANADAGSAEEGESSAPRKRGRKKKRKIEKTELQQAEIAISEISDEIIAVGHVVDDDDPLAGLMEVVEVHPPPSTDS